MRLKKALVVTVAAALLCTALCSCSKKDAASSSAATNETASSSSATVAEEGSLTEFPSDCKLSEDDMKAVVSAYADYMTEALKADGYVVQARFEDDGSVHYDGTRTDSEGNTDTIKDLTSYDSVKDAFAYLYNCGQVDLEGNLLVGVSEGVEEAVSEATSEAQDMAEDELAASESTDGEATDTEKSDAASSDGADAEAESDAAASSTADAE